MRLNIFLITLCAALVAGAAPAGALGVVQDGFSAGRTVETKFFTIHLADGVDELALRQTLNIGPEHKILSGLSLNSGSGAPEDLGSVVDALFGWTGGILDMQLFNYKGTIKVSRERQDVKNIAIKLYGHEAFSEQAFYIYDFNTIYIAAPDFTKEILGHEFGHAIICNFFVVQPPEKVQEVLAGYIEFQLRKISRQ